MPIQVQPFDFGAGLKNQARADRDITLRELALQNQQQQQGIQNQQRGRALDLQEDRQGIQAQQGRDRIQILADQLGLSKEEAGQQFLIETVQNSPDAETAIRYGEVVSGKPMTPELKDHLRSLDKKVFGSELIKQDISQAKLANEQAKVANTGIRQAADAERLEFDRAEAIRRQERFDDEAPVREAAQIKAVAAARIQRDKAEESTRKRSAVESGGQAISDLAGSILKNEDTLEAVYGTISGLIPSSSQETIDAEADIAKLVNLLTLENTDKMTGVLSESDIKILRDAGTVLGNFRISKEKAAGELKDIQGVFNRNPGAEEALAEQPQSFTSSSGIQFTVE